jgi:hypothetical protein
METFWMFVLFGGPGLLISAALALATQRWLLTLLAGAAGFVVYNAYLALADHSDPYGVCGECEPHLGNEVPILLPLMGYSNALSWLLGMGFAWLLVQAWRTRGKSVIAS